MPLKHFTTVTLSSLYSALCLKQMEQIKLLLYEPSFMFFYAGYLRLLFFANDDCSEAIKYLFYLFYTFGRCGVSHLRILRIKKQAFLEFYKKCQECLDELTNKGGFKKVAKFILQYTITSSQLEMMSRQYSAKKASALNFKACYDAIRLLLLCPLWNTRVLFRTL